VINSMMRSIVMSNLLVLCGSSHPMEGHRNSKGVGESETCKFLKGCASKENLHFDDQIKQVDILF